MSNQALDQNSSPENIPRTSPFPLILIPHQYPHTPHRPLSPSPDYHSDINIFGPYKLVTVNKVPARAKILIGRVMEDIKEDYTIEYVKNAETHYKFVLDDKIWGISEGVLEDVKAMVEEQQPDVLFVASMWTAEEANEIQSIAKSTKPGIKTMAIPHGLQVEKGPDAVVEFLKEQWPGLVEN
ncbi:hypothetical protein DID88_008081 [Monilinia fructigena]|uniref:Uncharacterized protein n=1 Tax=Monilinia fructigena TaxID=38457 RepID=A0A395J4A7_9HELO|nr:hypothetical protein DID88_008081 [Monilinia fructigena]